MEVKKINKVNWIGFAAAAACSVYIFVMFMIMFAGNPNYVTDTSGAYLGKLIICYFVFSMFAIQLFSLPYYMYCKNDGRMPIRQDVFGKVLLSAAAIEFILVIIFWAFLGNVFDGNAANPESTLYRFFDLFATIISFVGVCIMVLYTPHFDSIAAAKKRRNKI